MLARYLLSLIIVVVAATAICSTLPFVTRARVRNGTAVDETWNASFYFDAGNNQVFPVDGIVANVKNGIAIVGSGPVSIDSSQVDITPTKVSWTQGDETYSGSGASLVAQVRWRTSSESADGAQGDISIQFLDIPGIGADAATFVSGGYQKEGDRWVFRHVTSYQSALSLFVGRFILALGAGLPFAILLHCLWWAFQLKKEKRIRVADLAPPANALPPHIFHPSPIAEWSTWTLTLAILTLVASLFASFSLIDGFMSPVIHNVILSMVGIGAAIALIIVVWVRARLLTVRLDADGLSYVRGRGDPNWIVTRWIDLTGAQRKSRTYKGRRYEWVELRFADRGKLKITERIGDYPLLRDNILSQYAHYHPDQKS